MARPTYAGDGRVGIVGGAALGALAFGAAAGANGPPPPPPYGVEPVEVGPVEAGPPPCHDIIVDSFDPYAGGYVETQRRVCERK